MLYCIEYELPIEFMKWINEYTLDMIFEIELHVSSKRLCWACFKVGEGSSS